MGRPARNAIADRLIATLKIELTSTDFFRSLHRQLCAGTRQGCAGISQTADLSIRSGVGGVRLMQADELRDVGRKSQIRPAAHIGFRVLLSLAMVFTVVALVQFVLAWGRSWLWGVTGAAGLGLCIGLMLLWRSWLFTYHDWQKLLRSYGASRFQCEGQWAKATVSGLWILTRFDDALFGSAAPGGSLLRSARGKPNDLSVASGRDGQSSEDQMNGAARVDVFQLGNFSNLPTVTLRLRRGAADYTPRQDVDSRIEAALHAALARDYASDCAITLEISESWLQVTVPVGIRLGGEFGRRVETALDFCQNVRAQLEGQFTPSDPEQYTIEPRQDATFSVCRVGG